MKSLKTLLAVALLAVSATTATAATRDSVAYEFNKHAFLNLQGGAQYTLGEAKFGDLISPNVQIGLGYQFSPVFGARIQANAWQSKGGWNTYVEGGSTQAFNKNYKYKYVAPGIDLMFNLSNLFAGWNPNRVFNAILFVGGGANIAFSNGEVNDIASHFTAQDIAKYNLEYLWDGTKVNPFGRAGLQFGFRLSKAVALVLEGNANILSDHYNSKKAGNPDWYFNALAGLKINLGPDVKKVIIPIDIPDPAPVYKDSTVYDEVKIENLRRDIFFIINRTDIQESEAYKVQEIVDFMNKYPNAKVTIDGYADAGTGNDKINDRLAAGRADVVVKALVEKGISQDRITYDSHGSRVQPFAENDLNRVSICIADPQATESVPRTIRVRVQ